MKSRAEPDAAEMFVQNRRRLLQLLAPNSLVAVNANDVLPTNADGSMPLQPNSDLFYLTGVQQEQSILLLCPGAEDEKQREALFLREPSRENQLWEGDKLTGRRRPRGAESRGSIGWRNFRGFSIASCARASTSISTATSIRAPSSKSKPAMPASLADTLRRYPLHDFRRLAPLMHQLRAVKTEPEIALIRKACEITEAGLRRVARFVKPGVLEREVEAEFAHEFIRRGGKFAYSPIIASGLNACCLHYIATLPRARRANCFCSMSRRHGPIITRT